MSHTLLTILHFMKLLVTTGVQLMIGFWLAYFFFTVILAW